MRRLIEKRYVIKQNLLAIIGFCLFCYFSYHAVLGDRSYIRLSKLEAEIMSVSGSYEKLHEKRTSLEQKVVKLRPGSIDKDLLEERARFVLGYMHKDDKIIMR